jgi:hypothetical protein
MRSAPPYTFRRELNARYRDGDYAKTNLVLVLRSILLCLLGRNFHCSKRLQQCKAATAFPISQS